MAHAKRRNQAKPPAAPIVKPDAELPPILDERGQELAGRLQTIVTERGSDTGSFVPVLGTGEGESHDADSEAIAVRERLVRHALDAMAGVLLPEALTQLRLVLRGEHPAGGRGAASVNGAAKLIFDALRMTGAHVLDRDRTIGADALTVAELEAEVQRVRAALARKLREQRVVAQIPDESQADRQS